MTSQTYTVGNAALSLTIGAFSESLGICGPFTYTLTNPDSTFITATLPTISISTNDITKAGSYSLTVTG